MPGDILIGLAIAVIIIGFLILAGVAFWLALERRRNLSAPPGQPTRQQNIQPGAQQRASVSQGPAIQGQQAAPPASAAPPAAAENKAGSAAPAGSQAQKEVNSSGEYPSAALYDQTILPEAPKRRTRPRSN